MHLLVEKDGKRGMALIYYEKDPDRDQRVLAYFLLNGFDSTYARLVETVRTSMQPEKGPVLNLSYITTPVQTLQRSHLNDNRPFLGFAVSPKVDGVHCVLVLSSGTGFFLFDKEYAVLAQQESTKRGKQETTILEGELIAKSSGQ